MSRYDPHAGVDVSGFRFARSSGLPVGYFNRPPLRVRIWRALVRLFKGAP